MSSYKIVVVDIDQRITFPNSCESNQQGKKNKNKINLSIKQLSMNISSLKICFLSFGNDENKRKL
jgi:hypothetical protein